MMMEEMRGVKARLDGSGEVRWQRSWVEWGEWTSGCLLTFVFLVIMVGDVSATEPRLEGEGVLGERNLSEKSLEVGGAVYFFGVSSVIVGRSGETLTLGDLEVHDVDGKPGLQPIVSGRFTATEVGTRYVIQRLELIESPR